MTGNFLFEAPVGDTGIEAVSPYFGAVAMAMMTTLVVIALEVAGWGWWQRRLRTRAGRSVGDRSG